MASRSSSLIFSNSARRVAISGGISPPANSAWRVARRPMVDFTCDDDTVADLRRHLEKSPAMIYIVDRDKKPLLDELGVDYGECWLGLTVLPKQRSFEAARKQAVAKLRQIIVLREKACEDIKAALRCMPQEAQ